MDCPAVQFFSISLSFSCRDYFIYNSRKLSLENLQEVVFTRSSPWEKSRSFIRNEENASLWTNLRSRGLAAIANLTEIFRMSGSRVHTLTHIDVFARSEVVTARCPVPYCHLPPYAEEKERE